MLDSSQSMDELISLYFGDNSPENELQRSIMGTFAEAFEKTHLAPSQRPSNLELLDYIRSKHDVDHIFSFDLLKNLRIFNTIRNILSRIDIHPDPECCIRELIVIKVVHMIYPGDEFTEERSKPVESFKQFKQSSSTVRPSSSVAYSTAIIPNTQVNSSMQQLASQGQNSSAIYSQATIPMNNEATIQALIEQKRILQQQLMQRAHVPTNELSALQLV